jgi:hypothetical protein
MRNACKIFITEPERMRSLLTLRHRWKDNIKMDMKEIGYEDVFWI